VKSESETGGNFRVDFFQKSHHRIANFGPLSFITHVPVTKPVAHFTGILKNTVLSEPLKYRKVSVDH